MIRDPQVELMGHKDVASKCMHIVRDSWTFLTMFGREVLSGRANQTDTGRWQNFGMVLGMSTRKGYVTFSQHCVCDPSLGQKMG